MTDTIIILAGGVSSRMKNSKNLKLSSKKTDQANNRSKGLIEIGGKPFINYLINNIVKAGFKEIIIVVGEDNKLFKSIIENNEDFTDLNINFATQFIPKSRTKPFGTADAVYQTMCQYQELKKKKFCVCNSDNLYSINALKLLRKCKTNQALIAYDSDYLLYSKNRISRFAVMKFNMKNHLAEIIEKPNEKLIPENIDEKNKVRISMNIFLFNGNIIFKYLENCPIHQIRNEKELPSAIMNMIDDKLNFIGIPVAEHVPDLTSKDDIINLENYFIN